MNFAECLLEAVKSGELNREHADVAIAEWETRAAQKEADGRAPALARQEAADELVEGMRKAVIRRRHVTVLQLQTMQRNAARYGKPGTDPDLLLRDIERSHSEAGTIFKQAMGNNQQFLADHSEDIAGRVRGRAQLMDVVRELHGEDSGNANAKAIAGGITDTRARLRDLFNGLGGDLRHLDDYGVAHAHNEHSIRRAGFDSWFAEITGKLDWHRIENFKTGKPFALKAGGKPLEREAREFLKPIYEDIVTQGWATRTPGFSTGARALMNSRQGHRVLHFKSADDWMVYNDRFGTQNPFEAIIGQMQGMSTDIAMMRAFGPNPKAGLENAIQHMEKTAIQAARHPNPSTPGSIRSALRQGLQPEELVQRKAAKARVMLGLMNGELNRPADGAMAAFMGNVRNVLTAAQLGSATLSQVTDLPSMAMAAKAIGLNADAPVKLLFGTVLKGMDPQVAKDLGFIMDSWAQSSATRARFTGDIWSPELTGRISTFVLKANGMTYLTDRERVAVAMAFGSDLAGMAGKSFDELHPNLRNFMAERNIDDAAWDALRDPRTIYTDPQGGKHINPRWFLEHSSLPRDQAEDLAIRWGALIEDHIEMSIPSFSLRGKATVVGSTKPGTVSGELMRSVGMYKGFALSQLFNQMRRLREMDGSPGTKAGYAATMIASMTIFGALAVQLKEIAKGRDPRPMDSQKFWWAALAQGGGVGIFGDFFASSTSRAGGGFAETLAGPVVGLGGDLFRAVSSNAARVSEGKTPLIGRDVANLARRYTPGTTLWYTRLALDRLVWDQLQQMLDPEAEELWQREVQRTRRELGTGSWWSRGKLSPDRLPFLAAALGGTP